MLFALTKLFFWFYFKYFSKLRSFTLIHLFTNGKTAVLPASTQRLVHYIHRIYSKGYAYVAFRCVCRLEMCTMAACDTRSACRERDSPGIRFRKEGGTPRLLSSWHTLSLSWEQVQNKCRIGAGRPMRIAVLCSWKLFL